MIVVVLMRFMLCIGTGYLHEAEERRDSDFDIGSREFGDNFSPPDTMNSDEENGRSHDLVIRSHDMFI